ncbi:MAG: hypothetical protein ASARMPREDX12_007875 [Alectoria sarmentosa]|nr:MAG: hypothetical protein ASARMPREDX12_007875 [Alectoria sarmentosa]
MKGRFQFYAGSFEDHAGVGSSSVDEDRSDVQPSFEDFDFEHDTASNSGYLPIPHSSYEKPSGPVHRSSDPLPVHGTNFGDQTSHYASSEPPAELHGSTREYSLKEKRYHYDSTNRELQDCEKRLERSRKQVKEYRLGKEAAEKENESLRIQLFDTLKEAKKYDAAEKVYHETTTGRKPTQSGDTAILAVKYSFAAMLIEQKKFQEAEPISRAVWEERKQSPDPPSEVSMESHRQLCSVLCALGRHKDAENMHTRAYQREPMDAWALENGDEVCQRRREQGEIKRAKDMQDEVWKERQKQQGPRDALTIRSGLRLIGFLEDLVATIDQGGTDVERRLNHSHKQAFECEIEVILRRLWDTRLYPEPTTDILNAGHKLGIVLFLQNKFSDAEAIFISVWEGKKQRLGERDVSTMSTGSMLGKALYRQENQEAHLRAVDILQGIWRVRQTVMKNGDAEAISSVADLAQAYHSLGDWPNAEHAYRWIVHQKKQKPDCPKREIDDALWNLGQTLDKQGMGKGREAEMVLSGLYQQWNASSPNSNQTLQCGQMLAQSLSTQNGKINEALNVALGVFNRRASAEKGAAYLDSGRLYGSLLLKVESFAEAERILETVWEHQVEGDEEQRLRLTCGQFYGQALAKRHKYSDSKRILEAVAEAQGAVSAGDLEIAETRRLLEDTNRLKKERERGKRNSYRRRGFSIRC